MSGSGFLAHLLLGAGTFVFVLLLPFVVMAILILFGPPLMADAEEVVAEECTFNGYPLYGAIEIVDSFPDITVKEVTSFPDLKVELVSSFADDCGEWEIVESFGDVKIQFVDSFADIEIEYVTSFPGLE